MHQFTQAGTKLSKHLLTNTTWHTNQHVTLTEPQFRHPGQYQDRQRRYQTRTPDWHLPHGFRQTEVHFQPIESVRCGADPRVYLQDDIVNTPNTVMHRSQVLLTRGYNEACGFSEDNQSGIGQIINRSIGCLFELENLEQQIIWGNEMMNT